MVKPGKPQIPILIMRIMEINCDYSKKNIYKFNFKKRE